MLFLFLSKNYPPLPWSPQKSGISHRGCSKQRFPHLPWCPPLCCTSLWPPAWGAGWGCRASSSPAGSTACHSSPDHWLFHRSGKESRTYHSNLNINIFIYKVIFFQSVCQLFAPKLYSWSVQIFSRSNFVQQFILYCQFVFVRLQFLTARFILDANKFGSPPFVSLDVFWPSPKNWTQIFPTSKSISYCQIIYISIAN